METDTTPTPAGEAEALRAEVGRAMTDPAHPQHSHYKAAEQGNTKAWDKWTQDIYSKVYGTGTVELGEGVSIGRPQAEQDDESDDDPDVRARNEVILAPLRTEWGADYDQRFAEARTTVQTLFNGHEEVFHDVGSRVRMEFGPKGETAVLKLFAELAKIKEGG